MDRDTFLKEYIEYCAAKLGPQFSAADRPDLLMPSKKELLRLKDDFLIECNTAAALPVVSPGQKMIFDPDLPTILA